MVLWSGSRREGEAVACGKGLGLFSGLASTLHFPRLQRPKLNDPGDPFQPHKLNPWSDSALPSTKPRSTSPSPDWLPHRPPGCLFPLRDAWLFDTAAGGTSGGEGGGGRRNPLTARAAQPPIPVTARPVNPLAGHPLQKGCPRSQGHPPSRGPFLPAPPQRQPGSRAVRAVTPFRALGAREPVAADPGT